MNFHPVVPILRSFDERKAREFYIDWLGFKVDWEHRFSPDSTGSPRVGGVAPAHAVFDALTSRPPPGSPSSRNVIDSPLYMQVSRGDCAIHLSEHHGDGTPGTYVRIKVDEVEAYLAELQTRPYKNYRPSLHDMEWGARELCVQDGAGNKLIFYRDLR